MYTQKWMTLILTLVLLPGLVHTAGAAPAAARVNDPAAGLPQRLSSGKQLPVRLELVAGGLRLTIEARGAVLHTSDAQVNDNFGLSLSISGYEMVIGSNDEGRTVPSF